MSDLIDDDNKSIIQYVSKTITLDSVNDNFFDKHADDLWLYLVDRILATKENITVMNNRIEHIYMDRCSALDPDENYCGFRSPDLYEIVDAIDEENLDIINDFFFSNNYSEEVVEIMMGRYMQDFACTMDDAVQERLDNLGYTYEGVPRYNQMIVEQQCLPQNVILVKFLM